MKIAIQTIVFNGESTLPSGMLEAWLQQAEFADKILITEGATRARTHRWDGDTDSFTTNGKSTDSTVKIIKDYIVDKPKFHIKEADGFWDGKTSMFNYWFDSTNILDDIDYVWQIDTDEFYLSEDIEKIKGLLKSYNPIYVDFFANHFWGGFDYAIDERSDGFWANQIPWRRIFKINKGSRWISHEPPCMSTETTNQFAITKYQTLELGIKLYHYSYVTREQAQFKSRFFNNPQKLALYDEWHKDKTTKIFGCQSFPFLGSHPYLIKELLEKYSHD